MKHLKNKWKLGILEQISFSDVSKLVDLRNSEKLTKNIYDYIEDDDNSIIKHQNLHQFEEQKYQQLGWNLIKQNYHLILYIGIISLIKDVLYIINLYLLDQLSSTLKILNEYYRGRFLIYIICIIIQQLLGTFINSQQNFKLSNLKSRFYEQTSILVLQKQIKIYLYQTSNIDPIVLLSDDIGQIYEIFEILRKSFSGLLTFVFSFLYLKQLDENIWQTISLIIFIAQIYNFTLCYYYINAEKKYKIQKEIRTQLISQILKGIKQIKLLNLERVFELKIMNIRRIEFRQLAQMKILDGFGSVFWNNLTYLLLAAYLVNQFSKGLNFEDLNIIPIITMFNTLNFPLGILPWNINSILVGKVSYDRIVQFLQLQEVIKREIQQSEIAIMINQFNFGWQEKQNQILINNLQLKSNTIIGIVGAIGSGKTTFIKSLLNEIQLHTSQTSIVNGQIAYCPQTPWLINDSIRNNILFGQEYDEQFYNQVLDMCQIIQDINTFQERDQRLVGLNGCQMSGGQKQRIALARAIYQNANIYIFDDPLSSCDFEVSKLIIQKAFGYLIQKQKTIIISSNQSRSFEQINFDRIILIQDGQLKDQQIKEFSIQKDNNTEIQDFIQDVDINDTLNQDEDTEIKISLQTWIMWFSHMGWIILIMFTIANFMMQVCFSYIDFCFKYKMEKQYQNNDSFNFQTLMQFSNQKSIIFLVTLSLIITAIRGLFYALISITSGWHSYRNLNNSLMNSKLEFYENTQTGSILSRTSVDTYIIDTELSGRFHVFYEDISKVSGMIFGLLYLFPQIWIVLAYAIYSSFRLSKKFSEFNAKLNNLCSEFQDQLITQFNEIIQGTESIRVFEKQKHFQIVFLSKLQKYLQINGLQSRSQCWFQLRINLISNLLVAIIMAYIYFIESENVSQGQIILCTTYSLGLFDNLNQIFTFYIDFQGLLISFERVRQFYYIKQENLEIQNEKSQIKVSNQNILQFQNVSLQYSDKQVVLKNISFDIKQNQKIVIIGRTGSGKTSILNVLFRLYDYNSGLIRFNGVDIKQINLIELRSRISIIPQSGFIFQGTLLENLNPKNHLEQQQVIQFLNQIKLQFDSISSNLTDPQFIIQPNGDNLSTGEKQLLNIFRALLQDSEIICLDEAQCSFDPQTNEIINKILNEYTKNKTVITISHNLENLDEYDMIITMSQGEIKQLRYKNS